MNLEHLQKNLPSWPAPTVQAPKGLSTRAHPDRLAGAPLLMALKSVPRSPPMQQPSGFRVKQPSRTAPPCAPKMNGVTFWRAYAAANRRPSMACDNKTFGSVFAASSGRTEPSAFITGTDTAGDAPLERQIVAAWLSAKAGSPLFTAARPIAVMEQRRRRRLLASNPSIAQRLVKVQVKRYLDCVLSA